MTSTAQATSSRKITIWIWPTGLFPRRLVYYFRAKQLSHAILESHNIHLIPVVLDKNVGALITKPGYEERPSGSTLPCLRSEISGMDDFYIHETTAILEYLEEVFSSVKSLPHLRGTTPEQRARSGDIMSVVSDAALWHALHLVNSDPSTLFWSGLKRDQWCEHTAAYGKERKHALLSKLESWAERDIVEKKCKSLSGEGTDVTFADLSIMVCIEYEENSYGCDWVAEHGLLRIWYEKMKGENWFIGQEGLKALEDGEFKDLFTL